MRRIVVPSATSSRTMVHISARLRGSRPVVGSSRKTISGRDTSVIARSSRRRMPPEYVASGLRAASVRSNRSSSSATRSLPARRPRWRRSVMRRRFSSPVMRASTAENWPVTPIAARTAAASRTTSCPATRTVPPSGRSSVERMWIIVVFPAPLGPSRAKTPPGGDVEVDAVEHDLVAERLREGDGLDGRGHRRSFLGSMRRPPSRSTRRRAGGGQVRRRAAAPAGARCTVMSPYPVRA